MASILAGAITYKQTKPPEAIGPMISETYVYVRASKSDDATRNLETQFRILMSTGSGKSTSSPTR